MSWISSVLLAYSIGSVLWFFKIEAGYVFLFGLAFFFIMTELTKRFFNWVFPYFEIESKQFLPPKVRKLTLTILFGSGIIPALVLRIFGL